MYRYHISVYTHTQIHVCTNTHIHTRRYMYIQTRTYISYEYTSTFTDIMYLSVHTHKYNAYTNTHIHAHRYMYIQTHTFISYEYTSTCTDMGWPQLVGSLKLQVFFAEYSLFYRALLQKRPIISRSLLIIAAQYSISVFTHTQTHVYTNTHIHTHTSDYVHIAEPSTAVRFTNGPHRSVSCAIWGL